MDLDYLRDQLGNALSLGLAETATAQPEDPVDFLGYWLIHHRQKLNLDAQRAADSEDLARQKKHAEEMAEIARREAEEAMARQIAQEEEEATLAAESARAIWEAWKSEEAEEVMQAEDASAEDKAVATAQHALKIARDHLKELNTAHTLSAWKRATALSEGVLAVLKATLYILGYKKSAMDDWEAMLSIIVADGVVDGMLTHDCGASKHLRPLRYRNAEKIMAGLNMDEIAEVSPLTAMYSKWITACIGVREAVVARNVAAGKAEPADDAEEGETEE